uniref:Uncharacterized protein n=1 Tax=Cucumis melo TaxID=3656 RepID=A0A9I9EBJ0_CUCME
MSQNLELKSLATDGRVTCRWVLLLILLRLTVHYLFHIARRVKNRLSLGNVAQTWQRKSLKHIPYLLGKRVDKSEMLLAMEPYGNWVDTRRSYSQVELDEVQVELANFLGSYMLFVHR